MLASPAASASGPVEPFADDDTTSRSGRRSSSARGAEPEPRHHAGTEVVDHHVGPVDEPVDEVEPVRL